MAAMALNCFTVVFAVSAIQHFNASTLERFNTSTLPIASNRNRRLDGGMRVVASQFKILVFEIVDVHHRRIQFHSRQRTRSARKLLLGLFEMVTVEMQVPEGVDERAWLQRADLRDHQGQQGIGGNIERRSEEHTSEVQSHSDLVCRLLLEKKKKYY